MRKPLLPLAALALLPALAIAATPEQRLATALRGLEPAGPAQRCLYLPTDDARIIDSNSFVFRSGSRAWVNHPLGGCSAATPSATLVLNEPEGHPCRGDIVRLADLSTHSTYGSCALGDFLPYRRPPKR